MNNSVSPEAIRETPAPVDATELGLGTNWFLYPILVIYFLPVLVILGVAFETNLFKDDTRAIDFARIISSDFYDAFRVTLGSIFVPLITVYSVQITTTQSKLPPATIALFFILILLLLLTIVAVCLVELQSVTLLRYDKRDSAGKTISVYLNFKSTTTAYAKELLAYIAIALGVTLKK